MFFKKSSIKNFKEVFLILKTNFIIIENDNFYFNNHLKFLVIEEKSHNKDLNATLKTFENFNKINNKAISFSNDNKLGMF